jgi:hypothetical protein
MGFLDGQADAVLYALPGRSTVAHRGTGHNNCTEHMFNIIFMAATI